ncbi:hypothetical protein FKW77_005614 [Venturia effusa]|uniref:Uncharacterized protein n=1 Tax=Venturia effusa TaxID=50376 RepID=A0A517L9C0_9PEZI|nr:hypothetical protein FKW77_005614 [Venturia effusa]
MTGKLNRVFVSDREGAIFNVRSHYEGQIIMYDSRPITNPSRPQHATLLKPKIPLQRVYIAAGISAALVLITFIAIVLLIYWRQQVRVRQYRRPPIFQDTDDEVVHDPPSDNGLGVSFNVTPPLPPLDGASDSDEEGDGDGARHWSNGVIVVPVSIRPASHDL